MCRGRRAGADIVPPMDTTKRIFSNDPEHIREDLASALASALGPDVTSEQRERAAAIVASVHEYRDSQQALRDVLDAFGTMIFGAVLLHAIEAKDSLAGHAESISSASGLRTLGVLVRSLGWPDDSLSVGYREDAVAGYGPCSFADGLAKADELGYASPDQQCAIEKHLVTDRLHGSRLSGVRASLDGAPAEHWEQIVAAFDLAGAPVGANRP